MSFKIEEKKLQKAFILAETLTRYLYVFGELSLFWKAPFHTSLGVAETILV